MAKKRAEESLGYEKVAEANATRKGCFGGYYDESCCDEDRLNRIKGLSPTLVAPR